MPRSLLIIAFMLAFAGELRAQPILKCGSDMVFTPVLANMRQHADYLAHFDVIRETPVNVVITSADDQDALGMFMDETEANLSRLAYPRDTFGVRLIIQYRVDSSITTGYTQFRGRDTIRIVIPGILPVMRPCHTEIRGLDFEKGTLTLEGNIFTYDSVSAPASIVVQRTFGKGPGESIILSSNYPQYESQVLMAAAFYDRQRFRGSVAQINDEQFAPLRYLIRFHVVRLRKGSHGYDVH